MRPVSLLSKGLTVFRSFARLLKRVCALFVAIAAMIRVWEFFE